MGEKGYVSQTYLTAVLEERARNEKYNDWKKEKIADLSDEYCLSISDMEALSQEILAFKRDFTVDYINKTMS